MGERGAHCKHKNLQPELLNASAGSDLLVRHADAATARRETGQPSSMNGLVVRSISTVVGGPWPG